LSGQLGLFELEINDLAANPLFAMNELTLSMERSEIMKGDINIKEVIVSSPNISLIRDDSNQLNIYSLVPESNTSKKEDSLEGNTQPGSQKNLCLFDLTAAGSPLITLW